MLCPKCGSENADGTRFCLNCGAPLHEEQPAAPAQPTPGAPPPPPPPAAVPPSAPPPPFMPRQTSTMAVVSLITGIGSYVVLPLIGAIIAVITGHLALGEISRSGNTIEGRGLAIAGLVLGYLHLVGWIAFVLIFVFFGVAWCGCFTSVGICSVLSGPLGLPTPTPSLGGL